MWAPHSCGSIQHTLSIWVHKVHRSRRFKVLTLNEMAVRLNAEFRYSRGPFGSL